MQYEGKRLLGSPASDAEHLGLLSLPQRFQTGEIAECVRFSGDEVDGQWQTAKFGQKGVEFSLIRLQILGVGQENFPWDLNGFLRER